MDIFISDTSFQLVAVIDTYDSFIWVERYSDYGDFELYLPMDSSAIQYLKVDYYVEIRESNRTMIIEDIQIDTDVDSGPLLKISGRSLESILDRRIVWKQTIISNKMPGGVIEQLLRENIMDSAGEERCIPGFTYGTSGLAYENISKIPKIQFTGDNLYDVVKSICDTYGFGFKITGPTFDERKLGEVHFNFELFQGTNRSCTTDDGYDQLSIPHIVFSPNFDNLLNSSYYESHRNHKTVALVAGQGEDVDRVMVVAPNEYEYTLLSEKPSDWDTNYASYYTKSGEGWSHVNPIVVKPEWHYGIMSRRIEQKSDGTYEYIYSVLKEEPSDWDTNYGSYYVIDTEGAHPVTAEAKTPTWSDETYYRLTTINQETIGRGLSRRELFVDARDLSKESQQQAENGTVSTVTLSDSEYDDALTERGKEKLAECAVVESFEGGIDPNEGYQYGVDYYIGDIVQVENEYGMSCRCRVTEFIRSEDSTGSSAYPTFTKI